MSKGKQAADKAMRGTRGSLIRTALNNFAHEGIRAVSLRTITIESGALNKSAIQYHFKGRTGLTLAVLDYVMNKLVPMQVENLDKLEAKAKTADGVSVRGVLMGLYGPLGELYQSGDEGRHCVHFLSRLALEADEPLQQAFAEQASPIWQRGEKLLSDLLPNKNPKALQTHMIMSMVNFIQGLADINIMHATPFGDMSDFTGFKNEDAARYFLDYVEAGIRS